MRETSPDTARRSRSTGLAPEQWREVFTPWSEVADGDWKYGFAVSLLAIVGASWLDKRIGLAAWALALTFIYLVACFARWRHFRRGPAAHSRALER